MNSELENIIIELYGNLYNDKEEKDNKTIDFSLTFSNKRRIII